MDPVKNENVQLFLNNKLLDCERKIRTKKKKRRIIKIIYGSTMILSITTLVLSATISGMVNPLTLPIIIPCLSTIGGISTAVASQFKLKYKQKELDAMIQKFDKIKQQIKYVMTCDETLTNEESKNIMKEFL